MPNPNVPVIPNHGVTSSRFASNSSSSPSPRKTESADIFSSDSPDVRPTKDRQRPFSSKSNESQDPTSPLIDRIRKSFAICMYPDGESVIDPKNTVPSEPSASTGYEEIVPTPSPSEGMNKNDGEEVALVLVESEPEVRVLTPSSLKPVPGDIIRRSKEVKKQFTEPQDLNLDIIGKLLTLSPPKTEEGLKVLESALEKEEEVNLVQANMADALGGRAWELVTEERACSGERDDAMPGSVSDIRSPRVTPCRLLKLDIDAERKKLGNKSIEKLRKVEGKRQKLLQKKRICMKGKHGQKEQQTENDIKIKIVDQELKQLQAAMKREEMLKERKARLMEAIERQNRISSAKLVDEFITAEKEEDGEKRREDAEEKEEEARLRETKARSTEEEESTDKEENDDEPFNIDLDPEIEALMAEYQISPTSSQKERMLNEIAASVVQDEKTRAEKVKSFMRKTFSRQRNKVTPL